MRTTRTRRGAAMLMVTVALVVATVVGASIVSSRTTATMIGVNVTRAVEADWASESGARTAAAALSQSAENIESLLAAGGSSTFAIGGTSVRIKTTNLEGGAPSDDDETLVMTIESDVDGIVSTDYRVILLRESIGLEEALDLGLPDFAIVASDVSIESDALIATHTPGGTSVAMPAMIGAGLSSSGDLQVQSGAIISRAELWVHESSTSSLRDQAEGLVSGGLPAGGVMPLDLPIVPFLVDRTAFESLDHWPAVGTAVPESDQSFTSGEVTLPRGDFGNVTVQSDAELLLDDETSPVFEMRSLSMNGGIVRIAGDVALYIDGDVNLSNQSAIVLDDDATLTMFVAGSVSISDSVVNADEDLAEVDAADRINNLDMLEDASARNVRLLSGEPDAGGEMWQIGMGSVVVADIRSSGDDFMLSDQSTLVGRVTASRARVGTRCFLLYDTSLYAGSGFADLRGPMYHDPDEDGSFELLPGIADSIALCEAQGWYDWDWPATTVAMVEAATGEPAPTGGELIVSVSGESVDVLMSEQKEAEYSSGSTTMSTEEELLSKVLSDVYGVTNTVAKSLTDPVVEEDQGLGASVDDILGGLGL